MSATLLATLAVLALLDSTSAGTLVLPVWLLLAPRLSARRVLAYLATVAVAYLALGLVLALGARALVDRWWDAALASPTASTVLTVAQLALAAGLLVWSQRLEGSARSGEPDPGLARLVRWRDEVASAATGPGRVVAVALAAVALEAATMLPYLAAIGRLTADSPTPAVLVGALTGYCLVMVAPALALLGLRLALGGRATRPLSALGRWLERHLASATSWVTGIAGVLLALNALSRLAG